MNSLRAAELLIRATGGKGSGNFGHSGRPGERGGSESLFHGTISGSIQSIRARGLQAKHSGKFYGELSKTNSIYVTTDRELAAKYAVEAASRFNMEGRYGSRDVSPVVLEVVIPVSALGKMSVDEKEDQGTKGTSHKFKGDIKPQWIKRIARIGQTANPNNWSSPSGTPPQKTIIGVFKTFEAGKTLYVPWVVEVEKIKALGGRGSGNFNHGGRPGERGGSAEGSGQFVANLKVERALRTHKPSTKKKQDIAEAEAQKVADILRAKHTDDHLPLDITFKRGGRMHGVEVKTFIDNTNDKVTMHADSLARKWDWCRKNNAIGHTVVVDKRGPKTRYFYKEGFGSFKLNSLQELSAKELSTRIGRKSALRAAFDRLFNLDDLNAEVVFE